MVDIPAGTRWPAGASTGVGSWPGVDLQAAARAVVEDCPDLPYLPELPARGPGGDLLGRGASLLVGMPVELVAGRWRMSRRPGVDLRRGQDLLIRDLDAWGEAADGFQGRVKISAAGPWTLAAGLELATGHPVLADSGATADLIASVAEGVAALVTEVRRRVPGARVLLVLDEPSAPAVLTGSVPTASGLGRVGAVDPTRLQAGLHRVLSAATGPAGPEATTIGTTLGGVHCCAADPPVEVFVAAGAQVLSLDIATLFPSGASGPRCEQAIGEAIEADVGLLAGLVPTLAPGIPAPPEQLAEPLRRLWGRLGLPQSRLATQVAVTPSCGLAAATPDWARAAGRLAGRVGQLLARPGGFDDLPGRRS
ncbi:MAG: uroporphyrinogen decarboxylase/cobalamine-independent methonine synthase family protein [Actinomycetes bacterium]